MSRRGAGGFALLGAVSALVIAGCGGATHHRAPGGSGPVAPRTPRSELFGINAQFILRGQPSNADRELRRIAEQGIGVARADALWGNIEPNAPVAGHHVYEWGSTDRIEAALASRSLRWLPIADYSPAWDSSAASTTLAPPVHPAGYAAFAAAIAARYGPGGAFWREHPELPAFPVKEIELWNEENYPQYWGGHVAEPGRYLTLYLTARAAIHRAAPGVRALVGGLADVRPAGSAAPAFVARMARLLPGLARHLDGVALHPYAPDPARVLAEIAALRQALAAIGAGRVPIEVTEVGWSTRGDPSGGLVVSDARRGAFLASLVDRIAAGYCGVDFFAPFSWLTRELLPNNREEFFGLEHPGGALSAGGAGYASALARVAGRQVGSAAGACRTPRRRVSAARHLRRRAHRRRRAASRSGR